MQDRHGDLSGLVSKASRHDENTAHQAEPTTQSLQAHSWKTSATGSWITSQGADTGPRDEYGLPRTDAPINTHDFPSLAATAHQPGQARGQRPKPGQVRALSPLCMRPGASTCA